jgi:hypothetical protein
MLGEIEMLDIKAEFTAYCGPSARFEAERREGRMIWIEYSIPALGPEKRKVVAHLRNGLERVLLTAVRQLAASAAADAYRRTGQRDGDMAKLLQGKVL